MTKTQGRVLFDFFKKNFPDGGGEIEVQIYPDYETEETNDVLLIKDGEVILSVGKDGSTGVRHLVGQCSALAVS